MSDESVSIEQWVARAESEASQLLANAYAPYSAYPVAAMLLGEDGKTYRGVNVENASYGATICAERNAVAQAVAAGCREFAAIVIMTGKGEPASPCGMCRQVLAEFSEDMPVITLGPTGERREFQLSELLPHSFDARNLE